MKTNRIHIFGASGSGVTTLGKALSKALNIPVFDFDDYYWEKTDPPFAKKRERPKRFELLNKDIGSNESYIISGHYGENSYGLDTKLTFAIFLYTPQEIRRQRLRSREFKNFGKRMLEGGDMHEDVEEFIEWAMGYDESNVEGRTLKRHINRINSLSCPVIKLDGAKATDKQIEDLKNIIGIM